jgi:hypothetical protein
MTESEFHHGEPHFVTASSFLRIDNPRGGPVRDIYGKGVPIPQGAMTEKQIKHYLEHGQIARSDGKGNIDHDRVEECLSAIICCCADEPGWESWGRPRISERLRANGFRFSNKSFGLAIKRLHNPPQPEQD